MQNQIPDLAGDSLGSWQMSSIFLDAWADEYPSGVWRDSLKPGQLDPKVLRSLKSVIDLGKRADGRNPILNETYDDNYVAPRLFATNGVDCLFGYSEALHHVLKSGGKAEDVFIVSAPLASQSTPVFFTDALVLRHDADRTTTAAAQKFAEFMNSKATMEVLLLSRDGTNSAVPRYLIPAKKDAFQIPEIRTNRFYREIKKTIEQGRAYPNGGLYHIRRAIKNEVEQAVK